MHQDILRERASALASQALAWLQQSKVPPTPENYALAYTFVSGDNIELSRSVEAIQNSGRPFDLGIMKSLHDEHLVVEEDTDAVANLSEKIAAELAGVLQIISSASRDHSAYGKTLSQASGELGQARVSEGGIKTLIDQVVGATRAMETKSKVLEAKLQNSSREVTELRDRLDSVKKESLTDPLTGISNRKAFDTELHDSIKRAKETGEPLSLVMFDIDHFKKFNDTWGHQTGDQVLRLVASCLAENVKGRDTAARYGGEEFAVIFPQTDLANAVSLADQIRIKVESKKLVKKSTGDILGVINISAGVSHYDGKESAEEFLSRADICLYAAKHAGRNCVISETNSAALQHLRKQSAA